MSVSAAILAAGKGERFGSDKLAIELDGRPLWRHAVDTFLSCPGVDEVVLVGRALPGATCVDGGATRVESALRGVEACRGEVVLIHDAARPFVSHGLISRVLEATLAHGAAYPGVAPADTVRHAPTGHTPPRAELLAVQTPQGCRRADWLRAQEAYQASGENPTVTDDVELIERIGIRAVPVPGDPTNRKITTPADLPTLMETRTGMGYDIHPFSQDATKPLWLGGVLFEGVGLEGHSDADALLHAVVDALLGGAGLGDIGEHYPNTDPRWAGQSSDLFVLEAATLVKREGWHIIHIDACLIAERPKLMPRRQEVRQRIAELVDIQPERVSLKATTNERLGAIGRGEGIAALVVATLARPTVGVQTWKSSYATPKAT